MSLTRESVLAAARDVVRRHGPAKATVLDVAQALGVSHGSIYRFFPTKVALREAVVGAWLGEISSAMETLKFDGTALVRLKSWFTAYFAVKQAQRAQSPELFEAFRELSAQEPQSIATYKERLIGQVAAILETGIQTDEFVPHDPPAVARALLSATIRFHHPAFALSWTSPTASSEFETLWTLLVQGITLPRNSH